MPVMKVCAVKDRAVEAYGQPIFVVTIGVAVRSFRDEMNNEQSVMRKHPDDYDLYYLGEYDDATGRLLALELPELVLRGKDSINPD